MVFASIRHNLANLFRLSGRDSRASFWPYAIAVFLLAMAADILLFIPIMSDMMTRTMAYARAHPEGLPKPVPGQPPILPPELMPDMNRMFVPMTAVGVAMILLLAAAIVRRLHDRGKSGWWAALPLPFKALGLLIGPAAARAMTAYPPKPSLLATIGSLNGLCSLAAIVFLIVLLVGEGTKGPDPLREDRPA
ncbi:MAG: hypothetical protein JWO81_786 [Alphaproteobacteria bacterium]|nr:hypothetical protein [Alphaproteobacteria bacterium]